VVTMINLWDPKGDSSTNC